MKIARIAFVLSIAMGLWAGAATTNQWNGAVNGDWSNGGNWVGGVAPVTGGTNSIWLTADGSAPANQDIPGLYINLLIFSNNASGYSVGGNALTIKNMRAIGDGVNYQTNILNCGLILAANNNWDIRGKNQVFLNGSVGETGGSYYISHASDNTASVFLNGSNTFSGGIANTLGIVQVYRDENLGAVPASLMPSFFNGLGKRSVASTGGFSRVTIHANRGWAVSSGGQFIYPPPSGKLIYNAPIAGTGNMTINYLDNGGQLLLGGNNTAYNGNITLNYGLLTLMHSNALGTSAGNNVSSLYAATLDLHGYNTTCNITNTGPNGYDYRGSIINTDTLHPSTINGNVALNWSTEASAVAFGGAGDITVTGVVSTVSTLRKVGTGTLTLKGPNTHANATDVRAGGLTLDYTAQNNSKVGTSSLLVLIHGRLRLVGNDSAPTVQSIGTLRVGSSALAIPSGAAFIRLESGLNQNLTLAAQGIVHGIGAYNNGPLDVTVVNNGTGVASLTTTNANGPLSGGAATYNQSTWAKVVSGVVTGMPDSDYVTTFPGGTSTTHVDVPAGLTTIGANVTAATLRFNAPAGSTVTISSGFKLTQQGLSPGGQTNLPGILMTANSGAVIVNGPGTIDPNDNGPFFIHQYSANSLTLAANILAGLGTSLVKGGPGEVILSGTNAVNAQTMVFGGTLTATFLADSGTACPIGTHADLFLGDATFKYTGPAVSHNRRFILRGPGAIDASGSGLLQFNTLTNVALIATLGGNDFPLTLKGSGMGQMDGVLDIHMGDLIKTGSGTWTIGGTQYYTGNTIVSNGTLRLTNNCVLARSLTVTSGGTLAGSASVGEDLVMNGTRRIEIRGDADYDTLTVKYDATLSGALDIQEMNGYRMPANFNMSIVSAGGTVSGTPTVTGGFVVTTSADGKTLQLSKRYPGFIMSVR